VALKIRHNAVLGYFVETTAKAAEPLMTAPLNATFIHRQTLANQVRFTTVELAELDAKIAQAAERALAIELDTFEAWREAAGRAGAPWTEIEVVCSDAAEHRRRVETRRSDIAGRAHPTACIPRNASRAARSCPRTPGSAWACCG
jgi:hypothetical protein